MYIYTFYLKYLNCIIPFPKLYFSVCILSVPQDDLLNFKFQEFTLSKNQGLLEIYFATRFQKCNTFIGGT